MRCLRCPETAEGFAVIPGIGEQGEIRFYCDGCARGDRVKMRYWDGRDLDIGGHRDSPDLGESFHTLVFSFTDLNRLRTDDLSAVLEWADDRDIAAALIGMPQRFQQRMYSGLKGGRVHAIRELVADREFQGEINPVESQKRIVEVLVKL